MNLSRYNKLWVALVGAVVTALVTYYGKNQAVQSLVPFLTAIGVYTTPNKE